MRQPPWYAHLWPGFVPLWYHGAWSGLALAIGFTLLFNLTLLTSFVWTELVASSVRGGAWAIVIGVWGTACWASRYWATPAGAAEFRSTADQLFNSALGEYLRGNWLEAEAACRKLTRRDGSDVEAGLLLAAILRRTERLADASRELKRLELLETSAQSAWEIATERNRLELQQRRLREAAEEAAATPTENSAPPADQIGVADANLVPQLGMNQSVVMGSPVDDRRVA